MYGKETNRSKTNEQITTVVYLHVILFRMQEKMQLQRKNLILRER